MSGVAIVIAAYEAEATLDRAVSSALAQEQVSEVCVVDDASRDGTLTLAQKWAARDDRVIALAQPTNSGPSAARNAAIRATRSPWLAVLDADDYLLPGRMTALLAHAKEADFVADALIRVAADAAPPAQPNTSFAPNSLDFSSFVSGNLGQSRGPLDLGFLKPMFRRAFIEQHGMQYRESMRLGEDYFFYAEALARGARFLVGAAAGYVSVERAGSLSKAHSESDLAALRDCDLELARLPLNAAERRALRRHWTSVDCRLQWRRLISAVKARAPLAALSTFHTPEAALYLAARLGEQAWLRGTGRGPDRTAPGLR